MYGEWREAARMWLGDSEFNAGLRAGVEAAKAASDAAEIDVWYHRLIEQFESDINVVDDYLVYGAASRSYDLKTVVRAWKRIPEVVSTKRFSGYDGELLLSDLKWAASVIDSNCL